MGDVRASLADYRHRERTIPGNIEPLDIFGLSEVGLLQTEAGTRGDILEIGAFKGKSASLLGILLAADEHLVVCDLAVFDDYRAAHAPGVAAAVWEEVATTGLIPLFVSEAKLYGAWDPPGPEFLPALAARAAAAGIATEVVPVRTGTMLRLIPPPTPVSRRIGRALVPPVARWAGMRGAQAVPARRQTR